MKRAIAWICFFVFSIALGGVAEGVVQTYGDMADRRICWMLNVGYDLEDYRVLQRAIMVQDLSEEELTAFPLEEMGQILIVEDGGVEGLLIANISGENGDTVDMYRWQNGEMERLWEGREFPALLRVVACKGDMVYYFKRVSDKRSPQSQSFFCSVNLGTNEETIYAKTIGEACFAISDTGKIVVKPADSVFAIYSLDGELIDELLDREAQLNGDYMGLPSVDWVDEHRFIFFAWRRAEEGNNLLMELFSYDLRDGTSAPVLDGSGNRITLENYVVFSDMRYNAKSNEVVLLLKKSNASYYYLGDPSVDAGYVSVLSLDTGEITQCFEEQVYLTEDNYRELTTELIVWD